MGKDKKIHFAKYILWGVEEHYICVCGWYRWKQPITNITLNRKKVTCKNCKRTKAYKNV